MPSRTTSAEKNQPHTLPAAPVVLLPVIYFATAWFIGAFYELRNEVGIEIEPKLYFALFGNLPLSLCIGLVAVLWARSKLAVAISAGLAFAVLSGLFGILSAQALASLGAIVNQSEAVRITLTFVLQLVKYIIFAACIVAAMPNIQSMVVWTWQPLVGAIAGAALLELQQQSIVSNSDFALMVQLLSAGMLAWLGWIVFRVATQIDPVVSFRISAIPDLGVAGFKPAAAPSKVVALDLIPLKFQAFAYRFGAVAIAIATCIMVWFFSSIIFGLLGAIAVSTLFEMQEKQYQRIRDIESQNMAADVIAGRRKCFFLYLRPFNTDGRFSFELPELYWQRVKDTHNPYAGVRELNYVFETTLREALSSFGSTVGLGEPDNMPGIGHVVTTDDEWKSMASLLMSKAEIIWCVPGPQEGTLWEIRKILTDPLLLAKTVFVAPPGAPEHFSDGWRNLQDKLSAFGHSFPDCPDEPQLFKIRDGKGNWVRTFDARNLSRIRGYAARVSPIVRSSRMLSRLFKIAVIAGAGAFLAYLMTGVGVCSLDPALPEAGPSCFSPL